MDQNVLRRVKENLNAKFYLTNDTWLSDCVEYYLSEHDNPNDAEVLEFVISQWQLSDLREISNEKPSLPKNLAQQKCTTLRGYFILQMEKVYDIAESKYKQLEKIRNISTDNIRATETEATQGWEPKKKRMLQFYLTDGSQDITAIEYKPIRFLNDKLLPGYKLMIRGPVTCRRGVIMLDETNISEIGGEVEPLLVTNANENVLARALNLPENPDPYNDKDKPNEAADEIVFDDDFEVDMEAVDLIEKSSQEESTKLLNSRSSNTNSTVPMSASNRTGNHNNQSKNEPPLVPLAHVSESDLLFDMIDENEFEAVPKVVPQSRNISKTASKNSTRVLPQEFELPGNSNASKTIPNKFEIFASLDSDFLDEELEFEKAAKIVPQPQIVSKRNIVPESRNTSKTTSKNTSRVLSRETEFPDDDEFEDAMNIVPEPQIVSKTNIVPESRYTSKTTSKNTSRVLSREIEFPDDDEFQEAMKIVPKPQIVSKTITRNPVRVLPKESDFPDDDDELLLITDDTSLSSSFTWPKQSNTVKNNCQIGEMSKLKIDASAKQHVTPPAQHTIASVSKQQNQVGNKRNASVLSPPVLKAPAEKVRCTQSTPKPMKTINRKITDFMKKDNRPDSAPPVPKICDDISELLAANMTTNVIRKNVRSKFKDFDKLARNGDTWMLNATLMDETGSIDVVISSEILEEMLGFSVAEFRIKKKQKKSNPEVENELRQSFRSAENKIRNLDALLEVELAPNQKPKIVKIKNFTYEQRQILQNTTKLRNT